VVPDDHHVAVQGRDRQVLQHRRGEVVEGADDQAVGQQGGGLLAGAALGHGQHVGPQRVPPGRHDAVHHDLAGQRCRQLGEQVRVAAVRDGHHGDVRRARDVGVGAALDRDLHATGRGRGPAGELVGHLGGAVGVPGPDQHPLPRCRQPDRQSATQRTGAAEDPDHEALHRASVDHVASTPSRCGATRWSARRIIPCGCSTGRTCPAGRRAQPVRERPGRRVPGAAGLPQS
jgi:hypothetical protein